MKSLTLKRVDFYDEQMPTPQSYRMTLEVAQADGMPKEVLVKKRTALDPRTDRFVAVCSPAQVHDLQPEMPEKNRAHYRSSSADLVAGNLGTLDAIHTEVLRELSLLVRNMEALEDAQQPERIYVVTSDGVTAV